MVYHYAIAVDAERSSINNPAVVGRFHTYVLGDREIVSEVGLPIHPAHRDWKGSIRCLLSLLILGFDLGDGSCEVDLHSRLLLVI